MNIAIIAAAGSGSRMATDRPKQFLPLAGVPIIFHTLRPFEESNSIHEVFVVLPATATTEFLLLANRFNLKKLSKVLPGGATRAESVKRAVMAVRSATAEVVAIHDGVRPFVAVHEIDQTVELAKATGAAILVAPVTDTLKHTANGIVLETLDRSNLGRALTPQCFEYELLRRAYDDVDVNDPSLTDDSLLVERLGHAVRTIEGSARNIKITTQEDLMFAEMLLKS
ncbi:MAG: 2-C-methyl-D-erythritol 4-phosphate cytidylyltransferase [Pyrinomonadaceae bacterium]